MKKQIAVFMLAVCVAAACSLSARQAAKPGPLPSNGTYANSEAKLMADFKAKVTDYVKMRSKLGTTTPALKQTDHPAEINAAEQALAQKIREARPQAKRGDFFTPATAALFERLMAPAVNGPEGRENTAAVADDNPERVPFKVNGDYPKRETISTVPPDILRALPTFPEDAQIQYRFVGKHLILYDARSNLIMDYIFNAIP